MARGSKLIGKRAYVKFEAKNPYAGEWGVIRDYEKPNYLICLEDVGETFTAKWKDIIVPEVQLEAWPDVKEL